jgi:hypothetical protein
MSKVIYTIHPVIWRGNETNEVECTAATYYKHDEGYLCMDNEDSRYAQNKLFIPRENVKAIKQ